MAIIGSVALVALREERGADFVPKALIFTGLNTRCKILLSVRFVHIPMFGSLFDRRMMSGSNCLTVCKGLAGSRTVFT